MAKRKCARGLPPNVVLDHKIIAGRPRKTTEATNKLLKREVMKNSRVTVGQHEADHHNVFEKVFIRTLQHRLQKDFLLPSRTAANKYRYVELLKNGLMSRGLTKAPFKIFETSMGRSDDPPPAAGMTLDSQSPR